MRGTPFATWQSSAFGGAPISSTLLFFVLPMVVLLAGRRNPGLYGLASHDLRYHQRVGLRAAAVLLPVTLLFPVIGLLGTTPREWPGALLLAAGVMVATTLAVKRTAALDTREPRAISVAGTGFYLAMLVLGSLACFVFNLVSTIAARAVLLLIFVGFLEEFFFRGYLQTRLNDAFDRPYRVAGVAIGPGLFIGAAIFGLIHPLTSPGGIPWPWAVWTAAGGLLFGFLREKSGSVVAPAVAHGLFVLPMAFFSP
jgi:membrane protease YdiL (CAAX protease family)